MEVKDHHNLFFNKCNHHIHLELSENKDILMGFTLIEFESDSEFPNKICLQAPSMYYCLITSIEINDNQIEGWSINPVPCIQDANRIFGNNVYDVITFQMAYAFVSSNYGEKHSDQTTFNENRLLISIPDKYRLNKKNDSETTQNRTFYSINIKINFKILLNKPKSPITYIIGKDLSINISIVPQEYSKLTWFPTLSCSCYLTEGASPFWNLNWKFTCKVPSDYFAIMPGTLVNKNQTNNSIISIEKNDKCIYEYHYNAGTSFPHLYPSNVMLFIGKYHNVVKDIVKNKVSIFIPRNVKLILNIENFVLDVIDGYEKILNCPLPMEHVTIVLSEHFKGFEHSYNNYDTNRISDTLANVDFISKVPSPFIFLERNFYTHLNESDIGCTLGNLIVISCDLFENFDSNNPSNNSDFEKKIEEQSIKDNIKIQIRLLSQPILALLDSLASLWFGSYIHIINRQRLPSDGWLLFGIKRYLMRQLARKLCGEDLVNSRMKEALDRCLLLIENGNDYIPLSVKDFYLPLSQNDTRGSPLIEWNHREKQTIFRLKSDLVFHSLECFVNEMIKGKAKKVGFGFSDIDASFKHYNSQSKFFNSFIQSFIFKCCVKKNNRNFTTQHFFLHLVSCISQQFIHRSKKEIANAQIPQHEQYLLNEIQDELIAFRSAWIEGVGCPNLTITSMIQLSNKNTSFDNTTFFVDQTPLQPPHLTSKEGISSFIPIVSIFRIDLNGLSKNVLENTVLDFFSYLNGTFLNGTKSELSSSISKYIPSFLWPHDPNNLILKESNITLLGLGHLGRLPIPVKYGFGPLFDSTNKNDFNKSLIKYSLNIYNKKLNHVNLENDLNLNKEKNFQINSKNTPISSNGSYNMWQFGYMNVLCYIFLEYYENVSGKNDIEWLCSEIASHIPISGGSGRFWPGYTLISIIQNEESKDCELEIIEPQLPVIHELKIDTLKNKTGIKKESVSTFATVISSAACVQGVANVPNSTNTNFKMNEVPRLSLLQDLQQRKYFVGKLSNSDNIWLESLQSSISAESDSCNEEIIESKSIINSLNLNSHLLWIITDTSQYWLAKVFRFQTWSMWDQQFLNETRVIAQIEAANQLGMERYIFENSCKNKLILLKRAFHSLNLLMNSLYHFDWNLSVRKRALISIIRIYNKLSFQKLIEEEFKSIRIGVFSFLKKFIEEIKMIIQNRNFKNKYTFQTSIFIQNEKNMLFFSLKSLSLLWDFKKNSTSIESLYFLTQLLENNMNLNKSYFKDEFIISILEAIGRCKINFEENENHFPLNKIILIITQLIENTTEKSQNVLSNFEVKLIILIFKIFSKHPKKIFFNVSNQFRNKFGVNLDPLYFVNLPFNKENTWWKKYSRLQGSIEKPLYLHINHPAIQHEALKCYFNLLMQGFIDTLLVYKCEKKIDYKFVKVSPEIIYKMIMNFFFECNTKLSQNIENVMLNNEGKEFENLKLVGLFNIFKKSNTNFEHSLSSSIFPKNLLKSLCICTLIHILLVRSIKENLILKECNSDQWKIISFLWQNFIEVFDNIIQDFPQLFDQFLLVQVHAEFEPLINSISDSKKVLKKEHLDDVKQCCLFMSQVILNSPISLSSFIHEPIFQNIINMYISLFGHGVPVCTTFPPFFNNELSTSHLNFEANSGYILSGVPEMPMKEAVRKRQKLLRRGCDLSDSIQIRRLCDDEGYIMSRGWKHMCKKITQCLIESPYGAPFIHPVDENDAPEYYNLITQPIDLTTIMNKIKQDSYNSIEEYKFDVELIFNNCRKYNESSSGIVDWCNKIQTEFEILFKPVFKYFVQNKSI